MRQFIKKYWWYAFALPLSLWVGLRMAQGEQKIRERATYYTDPQTGCQYVSFGGVEGLSPRLDKEGKQICG